jgi:transposase
MSAIGAVAYAARREHVGFPAASDGLPAVLMSPSSKRITRLTVTSGDRRRLEQCVRARLAPVRLVLRSRIVLLAADGATTSEISRRLGIARRTVRLWIQRFASGGFAAMARDARRSGRRPSHAHAKATDLHAMRCEGLSVRAIAARLGVSASTVSRALKRST